MEASRHGAVIQGPCWIVYSGVLTWEECEAVKKFTSGDLRNVCHAVVPVFRADKHAHNPCCVWVISCWKASSGCFKRKYASYLSCLTSLVCFLCGQMATKYQCVWSVFIWTKKLTFYTLCKHFLCAYAYVCVCVFFPIYIYHNSCQHMQKHAHTHACVAYTNRSRKIDFEDFEVIWHQLLPNLMWCKVNLI